MTLWLDHIIFGSGYGLASPHSDQRFYWLGGEGGTLYTFQHGFGAQLRSRQWTHPKPGEERVLGGRRYRVFSSYRRWIRVKVAWALVDLPRDINHANAVLRQIEKELGGHMPPTPVHEIIGERV